MKIIFAFCFSFLPTFLLAQHTGLIKSGGIVKAGKVQKSLLDLREQNDYVISFRIVYREQKIKGSDYFVITRKGKHLSSYSYLEESKKLVPLNCSTEGLELVWDTFVQNDLFTMLNEKDIPNFCPEKYEIYDSYSYEFVLLYKDVIKELSYYDPEYYDSACYGMPERIKIINSVAAITHVLNLGKGKNNGINELITN